MSALEQHVPDGFRQSEIGIFPTDWKINSLAEISTKITDGTHDTPKPIKEGIPFLTAIHVKENHIAFESCYFLPKSVHDEIYKRCNPEYEDILMVNIGAGTGTTALVNVKYPFSLKNVALIKPDKKVSDGRFLNQVLSFLKDEILESLSAGGAQPFLSLSQIGQINVPTPSKEEQTTIANALSDVDKLLTELEKMIAKKQAIKTATMQHLLTGKTRLPQFATYTEGEKQGQPKGTKSSELGEIPEDWDVVSLGQASEFINGRAYAIHEWETTGKPVIRLQNLTGRGAEYYYSNLQLPEKQYCNKGDLLFMWSATFGPVIWKGDKAIYHYHIWKIKCRNSFSQDFLYFLLDDMTEKLKRGSSSGGTMLHVTKEMMESTKAIFPSFEEQTAIATILSDMDNEIQTLEQRLAKTSQIKQGMMQELLTGRTRLPFDKD